MSEMTKKLHYQTTSGDTGECTVYTTEEECPAPHLKVSIDGVTGYIKLSEYSDNPDKTPIRVTLNSDGKTYWVCKRNTTRFTITVGYLPDHGGEYYYGYRRARGSLSGYGSISQNPMFGITINEIQGDRYGFTGGNAGWNCGVYTDPSNAKFELYVDGVWVRGHGNASTIKNYVFNKEGQTLPFFIRTY